jgi:hypothetical protein
MIFFLCMHFYSLVWQATHEACSPAQLLQLLQPACYPETDASALAAQALAASEKEQERAVLQRNFAVGAAVSLALICIIVVVRNRR